MPICPHCLAAGTAATTGAFVLVRTFGLSGLSSLIRRALFRA